MATLEDKMQPERPSIACRASHEFFCHEMWKAALTELVGTATLMFTLTTTIISCLESHEPDPKLLLPFAVSAILFLFLVTTVPISGGHMSPVFSFIAALQGLITSARAAAYISAQCLGSVLGFLAIKTVMSHSSTVKYSLGGCAISKDLSQATALMMEFMATFVVLFVAVTVAFDKRRCKELGLVTVCLVVAATVGVVVFVSVTVTGRPGYAGVGLNPARCLGPAILEGGDLWRGHWVFWVGPFSACVVYYGYTRSLPKDGFVLKEGRNDLTIAISGKHEESSSCCGDETHLP